MEDRDFRVGDKVTVSDIMHGEIILMYKDGTPKVKFRNGENRDFYFERNNKTQLPCFHGHLNLDDIQKYIESKEHKPVRKVTKYINVWLEDGVTDCSLSMSKYEAIEKSEISGKKYLCIAHPIEVTE